MGAVQEAGEKGQNICDGQVLKPKVIDFKTSLNDDMLVIFLSYNLNHLMKITVFEPQLNSWHLNSTIFRLLKKTKKDFTLFLIYINLMC